MLGSKPLTNQIISLSQTARPLNLDKNASICKQLFEQTQVAGQKANSSTCAKVRSSRAKHNTNRCLCVQTAPNTDHATNRISLNTPFDPTNFVRFAAQNVVRLTSSRGLTGCLRLIAPLRRVEREARTDATAPLWSVYSLLGL
jgi:hypothetical protein